MANHSRARIALTFVGLFTLLAVITFSGLSGFHTKLGVFKHTTEEVTVKHTTSITPTLWTFLVWDFLYFWILAMFVYILAGLCRRRAYEWMYTMPAVLPYGFHVFIIVNICLNIAWMFLYDRELFLPVLIISALMALTSYTTLFFSCQGLKIYGAWLNKYHKVDLWLFRILVQNGMAAYATLTTLSTFLNLTIYLHQKAETDSIDSEMLSLLLLLMELSAWFLLENFYLDEHVRYIMTIYPLVILWLAGILYNSESPESYMFTFAASILGISVFMFLWRIALVTWRHVTRPLYKDSEPNISPIDLVMTQRKIFL